MIFLHDLEGLTNREITDALRISLYAAKVRLQRARKNLRGLLEVACDLSTDERGILVCEPKNR